MAEVAWTSQALEQLAAIGDFVARDSESQAEKLVTRLFLAAEKLSVFPQSGRVIPERDDESLRELLVGGYRVMYRLKDRDVEVVSVTHGRRLFRLGDF